MTKLKIIFYTTLPIIVIIGLISIHRYRRSKEINKQRIQKAAGLVSVTTKNVEDHIFCDSISFTGNILAVNRADLKAEEFGRVTRVLVREGDRVNSGFILSSQDEDDLISKVKVSEAHLAIVKAKAEQAKSDNYRAQNLLEKHSVTHQYAQQAETNYNAAMAEVRAAESNVNLAKSRLRKSRIIAPFAGEIAQRFIQPGEILSPGQTAFTIVDNRKLEIQANLPATVISKLKVGMKAYFKVLGFDENFQATLTHISGSIQQDSRTIRVLLLINNNNNLLKSGLFADGVLIGNTNIQNPALPSSLLTTIGQEADVFVVEGNIACHRKILVGPEQNGWRPVYGIKTGTSVVDQGRNLLVNGTPVKVTYDKTVEPRN